MFPENLEYEKNLLKKGIKLICGIDEVGRGPLAGPFVVSAVILDIEKIVSIEDKLTNNDVECENLITYKQIRDSKKLSSKKRLKIRDFLLNEVISYSIIEFSNIELDQKGITQLTQIAFFESIRKLKVKPNHVITDTFRINKITQEDQTNIPKGDNLSISVAAASIIAKEYRDNIMREMHTLYPVYGFDKHMGYGTKKHIEALKEHGPCEIHRRSFEPVKTFLNI